MGSGVSLMRPLDPSQAPTVTPQPLCKALHPIISGSQVSACEFWGGHRHSVYVAENAVFEAGPMARPPLCRLVCAQPARPHTATPLAFLKDPMPPGSTMGHGDFSEQVKPPTLWDAVGSAQLREKTLDGLLPLSPLLPSTSASALPRPALRMPAPSARPPPPSPCLLPLCVPNLLLSFLITPALGVV